MGNKIKVSLKDVAKKAGVSISTVSVVCNNQVGRNVRVSQETQERVRDAIRDLGYVADPAARSLAGGKNQIIAIFTYEPIFPFTAHNFFYPFLLGIEREAEKHGYDLLLMTSSWGEDGKRVIFRNGANRLRLADGAILFGLHQDKEEVVRLMEDEFPFIIIGRRKFDKGEPSYVTADYIEATVEMVGHIAHKGHQRIAYFRLIEETEPSSDREKGILLGQEKYGLLLNKNEVFRCSPEAISSDLIRKCLNNKVTVFVVESHSIAECINRVAQSMKLQIPHDFSLAVLGGPSDIPDAREDWTS